MLLDVAYVGNRADDLLLFANYNQALPEQRRRARSRCRRAGRSRSSRDITYAFNGGKSRYKALQAKLGVARQPRRHAAQLADAVEGEGQRRAVARELERQLPGAAGLPQPRRRLRAVGLRPAVQQHHQLRLGAAVRPGPAVAVDAVAGGRTRWSAAGSSPASTSSTPASRSRSSTRRRRPSRSRASRRTSAAPTTTGRT